MILLAQAMLGTWLLLLAAGVMLYVSSRVAAGVGARGEPGSPGRALGHWLPIAAVALVAVLRGQGVVAVAVVLATTLGCLALVMGLAAMQSPIAPGSARSRRAWGFILPAGLLLLLIGLRVEFSLLHAVVLAVQGLVVLMAAEIGSKNERRSGDISQAGALFNPHHSDAAPAQRVALSISFGLAMILALLGAWAATESAIGLALGTRVPLDVLATGAISALLVLPIIGSTTGLVHRGLSRIVGDVQVRVALLNLCLLLPLVIVLWTLLHDQPLAFPMRMWRVDAVVLTVLGLLLLPVALGRWSLERYEGIGLVIAYGLYLMAASWMATR
jgi:cation:H+ antiporter